MNKQELAEKLAEKLGATHSDSKRLMDGAFSVLSGILINQDSFTMQNFGTFEVHLRKERKFFNPLKLRMMSAPQKLVVSFHPSKHYTEEVNENE